MADDEKPIKPLRPVIGAVLGAMIALIAEHIWHFGPNTWRFGFAIGLLVGIATDSKIRKSKQGAAAMFIIAFGALMIALIHWLHR